MRTIEDIRAFVQAQFDEAVTIMTENRTVMQTDYVRGSIHGQHDTAQDILNYIDEKEDE